MIANTIMHNRGFWYRHWPKRACVFIFWLWIWPQVQPQSPVTQQC